VKVYDSRSGDVLQTISTDDTVHLVQFSIHGEKLLYTNRGEATIWDLSRNTQVSTINYGGYYAAFSPDGTRVASSLRSHGYVKIWNTENDYLNSETASHDSDEICSITFAPDGRVMASRSNHKAKIWDATSVDCLFTLDFYYPLQLIVFSPNSAFFACVFDNSNAQVWDVLTRRWVKDVCLDVKKISMSLCPRVAADWFFDGPHCQLHISYYLIWRVANASPVWISTSGHCGGRESHFLSMGTA
jgi:WD40 repeat protein